MHKRAQKEKHIVETMIHMYCNEVHNTVEICNECRELIEYAEKRLLSCPFLENKPVCSKCEIHCYNKKQQDKVKDVMRKVGPKMIYLHTRDTLWYYYYKFIHKNQKTS